MVARITLPLVTYIWSSIYDCVSINEANSFLLKDYLGQMLLIYIDNK